MRVLCSAVSRLEFDAKRRVTLCVDPCLGGCLIVYTKRTRLRVRDSHVQLFGAYASIYKYNKLRQYMVYGNVSRMRLRA